MDINHKDIIQFATLLKPDMKLKEYQKEIIKKLSMNHKLYAIIPTKSGYTYCKRLVYNYVKEMRLKNENRKDRDDSI